jgi:hypothetical protein
VCEAFSFLSFVLSLSLAFIFIFIFLMDIDCRNEFYIIQQSFLVWEVRKQSQFWTKKTDADTNCLLACNSVNSLALQLGLLIMLPSKGKHNTTFLKGISPHITLHMFAGMWNVLLRVVEGV